MPKVEVPRVLIVERDLETGDAGVSLSVAAARKFVQWAEENGFEDFEIVQMVGKVSTDG